MPEEKLVGGNDFVFRVEGVKLDAKAQQLISNAIANAVNVEIGRLNLGPQGGQIILPTKWPGGIWIRLQGRPGSAQKIEQVAQLKPKVTYER